MLSNLTFEAFLPWLYFLIFPLIVLVVGALVSFFSSFQKRALVGGVLILLGSIEILFAIGSLGASLQTAHYFPPGLAISLTIGLTTAISGIVSLYKSRNTSKTGHLGYQTPQKPLLTIALSIMLL
jgi:uncharacterized membrane protein YoaK (UPF0700 family)